MGVDRLLFHMLHQAYPPKREQSQPSESKPTTFPDHSDTVNLTVRKQGNEFVLVSKKGKSLGRFRSRAAAARREQQVNFFKSRR